MKISVCLAAYKGEDFIVPQVASILSQLGESDELIISDDESGYLTAKAVKDAFPDDGRIIYISGPSRGVVSNFENALRCADGDVIFLSDQDDIWCEGKVEKVLSELLRGADLVLHDARLVDRELNILNASYFEVHGSRSGFLRNFIRNSYMGCCMAFKRELLARVLPFPENIPMHDQWIGLIGERTGKVSFIAEPLILHRQHGGNVTGGKTSFKDKLMWRISLFRALIK